MVVAFTGEPTNLDPLAVSDGPADGLIQRQLYDSLVTVDAGTGEIRPWLATWTVGPDGRTYELEIAANASWSDGRPIVGEDFVTSVRALARSKKRFDEGRPGLLRIEGYRDYRSGKATTITGLRADGKHLTVRLDKVFCPMLVALYLTPPIPTHVFGRYLSDTDLSMNGDAAPEHLAPTVTSGPFVFGGWRRGDQVVLRANGTYWKGRPRLDELVFRMFDATTPPTTLTDALRSGVVDLAFAEPDRGMEPVRELERDPRFRVARAPRPGYTFIGWNPRSATAVALRDKRVRQALAYGLDIDAGIRGLIDGEGVPVRQHMNSTSWAYTPGLNEYRYDPSRAEELIRSAGYSKGTDGIYQKDGRRLAFALATNPSNAQRTTLLQFAADQYRAIGVEAIPRPVQFTELVDLFRRGDPGLDAIVLGWTSSVDPFTADIWYSKPEPGGGLVWYGDEELDRALDVARLGPDCSTEARKRGFDVLNRRLNEDQPYNFLWTTNVILISTARVRAVFPGSYRLLYDAHLWWAAPR